MRKITYSTVLVLVLLACTQNENKSTRTHSSQFKTNKEKLAFLRKYVVNHSKVLDAEYTIWYQDNSTGGVPGPSDYLMSVAIKTDKDSIGRWVSGFKRENFAVTNELWKDLPIQHWQLAGEAQVFTAGSSLKVIYPESGVLLGYFSSMPTDFDKYKK
jgi:hypothetical protein